MEEDLIISILLHLLLPLPINLIPIGFFLEVNMLTITMVVQVKDLVSVLVLEEILQEYYFGIAPILFLVPEVVKCVYY